MVSIYIATFNNQKILFDYNDNYKVINCGNALLQDNQIFDNFLKDDIEDNISNKNLNYNELTALYWIWKNDKTSDYLGLCHYRRFLKIDNIEETLKEYDFIVPERAFLKDSIEKEYYRHHQKSDWELMLSVLSEKYPDYYESSKNIFNKDFLYVCNMFIVNKENFNKYCEWLFDILFEIEKRQTRILDNFYQNRYLGFLGERLLTLYVLHNNFKISENFMFKLGNAFKYDKNFKF